MRKKSHAPLNKDIKIMIIDDEDGIIDSVSALLQRNGYYSVGFTNPLDGLEELSQNKYDLLILDFFMQPLHGDAVVEQIRRNNKELYILLLTGYKDLAPPLSTIRALDIQAYCEKSDRLDQLLLLVESGVKSINQMRTILMFRDGLNNMLNCIPSIYQLQSIGNILESILSGITQFMPCENAFILIDDMHDATHTPNSIFRGIGEFRIPVNRFTELIDPELMESIGIVRNSNLKQTVDSGIIYPLLNEHSSSIGILYVQGPISDEYSQLLSLYTTQAAASVNNAFLHSLVNMKNSELSNTYLQLKTRYMDTIEVLRLAVDAKDVYTKGHSDRVAYYATRIGQELSLSDKDIENLRIAGYFHDIGKIGTSDDVLLKSDALEKFEYEEIKKHPVKSAHILAAVSMFKDVVPIVRQHHERIDGTGYPDGLKGENINYFAKILTIADAFDAMTSDRHYRAHLSIENAINQLVEGAGTQFDDNLVTIFLKILSSDPDLTASIGSGSFIP